MNTFPTIPEVLADPCASYWLKDALRSAVRRDIVDAINDAETLVSLLTARLESITRSINGHSWNEQLSHASPRNKVP
jgi:hypothetical protein